MIKAVDFDESSSPTRTQREQSNDGCSSSRSDKSGISPKDSTMTTATNAQLLGLVDDPAYFKQVADGQYLLSS